MPSTRQTFQPAAKMAQRRAANVSNAGNPFVPKPAPSTLFEDRTTTCSVRKDLPRNQQSTNNKMRNGTVPSHVAPL